jgi:hypothetical protein
MVWIKRTGAKMGSVLAGECVACKESNASGHNGPQEFGNSLDEGGNATVWQVCERQVGGLETRGLHPPVLPSSNCILS